MKFFFLSADLQKHFTAIHPAALEFSRLPHLSSTVYESLAVLSFPRLTSPVPRILSRIAPCKPPPSPRSTKSSKASVRERSPPSKSSTPISSASSLASQSLTPCPLRPARSPRSSHRRAILYFARRPVGPLHGVPLTIKSCIDVAGWPAPAGSVLRMGYIPQRDAPLVTRLKTAGAILLGNQTLPNS